MDHLPVFLSIGEDTGRWDTQPQATNGTVEALDAHQLAFEPAPVFALETVLGRGLVVDVSEHAIDNVASGDDRDDAEETSTRAEQWVDLEEPVQEARPRGSPCCVFVTVVVVFDLDRWLGCRGAWS